MPILRNTKKEAVIKDITVIGGGVVGASTALHLASLGYQITIVDQNNSNIAKNSEHRTGSTASLGVLMGNIFTRHKGRSWELRKRSMEIWPELIKSLSTEELPIIVNTPLVKIASSKEEMIKMENLIKQKKYLGIDFLPDNYQSLPIWIKNKYGGLISYNDGQINSLKLIDSLFLKLKSLNVNIITSKVKYIKRINDNTRIWSVILEDGKAINSHIVIICAAAESERLLQQLNYKLPLTKILGQAIKLKFKNSQVNFSGWPAIVNIKGINLIPEQPDSLLIGATLENELSPDKKYLHQMLETIREKAEWMQNYLIKEKWYGHRAKPINEPAPILKSIEKGLIINTAHYRNGVLLSPACAEWVSLEINKFHQ